MPLTNACDGKCVCLYVTVAGFINYYRFMMRECLFDRPVEILLDGRKQSCFHTANSDKCHKI